LNKGVIKFKKSKQNINEAIDYAFYVEWSRDDFKNSFENLGKGILIDIIDCYIIEQDLPILNSFLKKNEGKEIPFLHFPDPYCQCHLAKINIITKND
jgi:hypothetical protein